MALNVTFWETESEFHSLALRIMKYIYYLIIIVSVYIARAA